CSGDCPHCLATVDGVSYIRTCQVKARSGQDIALHHLNDYPPITEVSNLSPDVHAFNKHADVVVIGQGVTGQAAAAAAKKAGKSVITLDVKDGQEAVGIYAGPLVVARTEAGMWHIHVREEIIVATGAAELAPVVPGSHLRGIYTSRAAECVTRSGISLGQLVAVGTPPNTIAHIPVSGELVRFEGDEHVCAVVVRDAKDIETRHACDHVCVGLGLQPRDALHRMGQGLPVRAVGDAAIEASVPKCPVVGIICPCSDVSVADLQRVWKQGFQEMELIKRATLAGTGTCQGGTCIPYLRSFIRDRGSLLQPAFTARPLNKQLTIAEIAAGAHHPAMAHTALVDTHRALGGQMERSGHWWRAWHYGDRKAEYMAVRGAVSLMDVSTLGKFVVSGPDALPFLERIYPTKISTLKAGRSRYVLALNERGYVFDDGMVIKDSDTCYTLTFTSGGSSHAEMWLRDWASTWGYDVRILNQTYALGAINVTGPKTNVLMHRAGVDDLPSFLGVREARVAGISCRIYRLSFTGELSYELHHSAKDSVALWQALMKLGQDLGITPHGLETLLLLRLEKGHIIVGQDSDYDSSPRRLNHDWAVKLDKSEPFIGKNAVIRTNKVPLDKMLVGFEMEGDRPLEGAVLFHEDTYVGYVTSSGYSHVLGKSVMLGWLYYLNGELPCDVTCEGRPARRVSTPFYDKESLRARA
ncbi:MAG: (2Fe-2S)-binding protein, partial [Verrucomicrobia bacterium]|nr:(2Fe-2S)-binding protein [Verrucomicrobiota bacterium]